MIRSNARHRRGVITIIVVISLVAVIGILAIALDGGLLIDNQKRVQAAADSAALAAATDLFEQYGNGGDGTDPSGSAATSGTTNAAANGFSNDGTTSTVAVNIPPKSGNFKGKAGYAEAVITFNQKRGFSGIFGTSTVPVTCRAVACGKNGAIGILVMDTSISDSCEIDCTCNILNGGQVYVNSSAADCTQITNGGNLSCGGLNIEGTLKNQGSVSYTNGGSLSTYTKDVADPLASIPEPTTTGLTNYGNQTITSDTTLQPGIYGQINISTGKAVKGVTPAPPTVTMAAGIYYFANGGSIQLQSGTLQGTGVMIFDNTGGDNMLNGASGVVNLTPPTSSSGGTWPTGTTSKTYQGISFWIPRAQTKEVHIKSDDNLTMSGTFYAQAGEFDLRPNLATTTFNVGNYICDQAEWGPSSLGTINMNPGSGAATQRPFLVE